MRGKEEAALGQSRMSFTAIQAEQGLDRYGILPTIQFVASKGEVAPLIHYLITSVWDTHDVCPRFLEL